MPKKTNKNAYNTISIDIIDVNPSHIRKTKANNTSLINTISDAGLLQPILVRKREGRYVIIDGSRRLEALKELDVKELIIGKDVIIDEEETEADLKFKQIIANIQREDINDIELGHAFVSLKEQFNYQYKEIAEITGKSQHYIASKVGLAKRLSEEVQEIFISDLESAKCIQNTFSGDEKDFEPPYFMNINILEDIARLPEKLQRPAYDIIRSKEMDKKEALKYLILLKKDAELLKIADDVKGLMGSYAGEASSELGVMSDKELNRYFKKINRDLDKLADKIKSLEERESIKEELESLIDKLNSLYAEVSQLGESQKGFAQ
jgi:ParB family chromosome partitioning protein